VNSSSQRFKALAQIEAGCIRSGQFDPELIAQRTSRRASQQTR